MNAQFEFRCLAFHEGLAHGRAPGHLHIDQDCIEFVVGENTGSMSLHGMQLHAGGTLNRQIIITHPIWRGWTFRTSNRALLQNPFLRSHPATSFQIDDIRRKRRVGLSFFVLLLVAIILTSLYFITRLELVSDRLSRHTPPAWESSLGKLGLQHYQQNRIFLDSEKTSPLLAPFAAPLLESLPEATAGRFVFYLVEDAERYALALPGGHIVIHTGLIEAAGSADVLMALLAHEISHATQHHSIRNLLMHSGLHTVLLAVLGDSAGWDGAGAAVMPQLLNPTYSARLEAQADVQAYNLLKGARLPTTGLHERLALLTSPGQNGTQRYVAAHPMNAQHKSHLQSLVNDTTDGQRQRDLAARYDELIRDIHTLTDRTGSPTGTDDAG